MDVFEDPPRGSIALPLCSTSPCCLFDVDLALLCSAMLFCGAVICRQLALAVPTPLLSTVIGRR